MGLANVNKESYLVPQLVNKETKGFIKKPTALIEHLTQFVFPANRLQFGSMSRALDEAYDKVQDGSWTKQQSFDYLQVHAVNEALRKKFWRTTQHNMHW